MPIASISAALAWPTALAAAHRRIFGTKASRAVGVSSFESRRPAGMRPVVWSTTTMPAETGPPSEPRPTSSLPATHAWPSAK